MEYALNSLSQNHDRPGIDNPCGQPMKLTLRARVLNVFTNPSVISTTYGASLYNH
jgi:hypothetical protein